MLSSPRVLTSRRSVGGMASVVLAALLLSPLCLEAQHQGPPPPPPPPAFGVPLQGLTPEQVTAWQNGKALFTTKMVPTNGLGPIFNRDSCVACHSGPAPGGSSHINGTRFGKTKNGVFDPLIALGGSLLQTQALKPIGVEMIPPQANTTAQRNTPPLYGLGLIDAIPSATILAGVRTTPFNGVLGTASTVTDPVTGQTALGRFGWKAQQPSVLAFAADAFNNEMGITNRLYPTENAPNGNQTLLVQMTLPNIPEPNDQTNTTTGKAGIDVLADFLRLTAPPPPQPGNASTLVGAKFFVQIGCNACHTPAMTTGSSPVAALSNKTVPLYSDLLLHNMGTLGDGIAQGSAGPTFMRTPPLWGLAASAPYLHDGRAATVDAAIRAHTGEASYAVSQYLTLTSDQQALLVQFLNSL